MKGDMLNNKTDRPLTWKCFQCLYIQNKLQGIGVNPHQEKCTPKRISQFVRAKNAMCFSMKKAKYGDVHTIQLVVICVLSNRKCQEIYVFVKLVALDIRE